VGETLLDRMKVDLRDVERDAEPLERVELSAESGAESLHGFLRSTTERGGEVSTELSELHRRFGGRFLGELEALEQAADLAGEGACCLLGQTGRFVSALGEPLDDTGRRTEDGLGAADRLLELGRRVSELEESTTNRANGQRRERSAQEA